MNCSTSRSNGCDAVLGLAAVEDAWLVGRPRRPGSRARPSARTRARPAALRRASPGSVGCLRARAWIEGFSSAHTTKSPGPSSSPLPASLVEVEDPAGLLAEARVAREDPGAVVPRADRVRRSATATPSRPRSARRSRARPPPARSQRLTSVRAGRPSRPAARTPAP